MFTHTEIWSALDRLAQAHSTSPSGLAKLAGLDPTSFNKSKRRSASGKNRWPSTESLSKVLSALGLNMEDFAGFIEGRTYAARTAPLIGLAQAGDDGFFDDSGFPTGAGWEEIDLPSGHSEGMYVLEISGQSMSPVFRHGEKVIVAPHSQVRRGDRVVVKTLEGEVLAKELVRLTESYIELHSVNPEFEGRLLARKDIAWIARIMWVSQ
jgi:phage repressor protein C with HTH and peptisase S24 domain